MADLRTTYMGVPLRNPLIVSASALTANIASIERLEDGGTAAVVTTLLFKEHIQVERFKFDEDLDNGNCRYAEMITVHPHLAYAVDRETWLEYARKLEDTGVDTLECNFFSSPKGSDKAADQIEDEQVATAEQLKGTLRIPFSVKLSFFCTTPLNVIRRMNDAGTSGFVLFNRLVQPDTDTREEKNTHPFNLSYETDCRLPLRHAGLLEGEITADVCCSKGIFDGETIAKTILAGAKIVQIVSALFRYGSMHIRTMTQNVKQWMATKGYKTLADFRRKFSRRHVSDPWAYTRAQYVRLLMNPGDIPKKVSEI